MFNNIGRKIKVLAMIFCWVGIITSIISGIEVMEFRRATNEYFYRGSSVDGRYVFIGILIMIVGSLLSWIGSFLLYGFGEMVENSDIRTELAVKEAMAKEAASDEQ